MRPVRIPLSKGLMGLRLLMIRPESASQFFKEMSLSELKEITMTQGEGWPDTQILTLAGFKIKTNSNYFQLFEILKSGEVEAFPRSIVEIYAELKGIGKGFVVAPGVALKYSSPSYFFTRQADKALAERLETGLRQALDDGSFDALFDKYFGAVLEKADLKSRTLFNIENPFLHKKTPLNNQLLWYRID